MTFDETQFEKDSKIINKSTKTMFAFTITVKPFLRIGTNDLKKPIYYRGASMDKQYNYICKKVKKIFETYDYKINAEEHANGNLHFHGIVYIQPEYSMIKQNHFAMKIGRSELVKLDTLVDVIRWNKYINKTEGSGEQTRNWDKIYKEWKVEEMKKDNYDDLIKDSKSKLIDLNDL